MVWGGAGPPALANGEVLGERWDPLPLPGPRYGHCAAVLMSEVYLLGGVGGAREAFKWRQRWRRSGRELMPIPIGIGWIWVDSAEFRREWLEVMSCQGLLYVLHCLASTVEVAGHAGAPH